jgi:hypothetical protein
MPWVALGLDEVVEELRAVFLVDGDVSASMEG